MAVIGEGKKFISALVVPNFEALQEFAKTQKIKFENIKKLIKNSDVISFYNKRVAEISGTLARYEQIKKFKLLPEPFSQDKGEITATLKLKRQNIAQNYKQMINGMYA